MQIPEWHYRHGGKTKELGGAWVPATYGDEGREYRWLKQAAGFLDLSGRSRLCVVGPDRARYLHGQVTNDVKALKPGTGCYAAIVSAKGKLESDLNVVCLENELLLDFEPGLAAQVKERLERTIVADQVEVVEVGEAYGLLSVQGPASRQALELSQLTGTVPENPGCSVVVPHASGDICIVAQPRLRSPGFDVFAPAGAMEEAAELLMRATEQVGGGTCGWNALEIARVEAGIPRYGVDMDQTTFPQEAGIEARAVSYRKGCYVGQEVLNRIHTMGHVNRKLHQFRLTLNEKAPVSAQVFCGDKVAGNLTSTALIPDSDQLVGMGYLRRGFETADLEICARDRRIRVERLQAVA